MARLKVLPQPLDLRDDEVHVLCGGGGVGNDHPEEVDAVAVGLVANQQRTLLHHALFDLRGNLQNRAMIISGCLATDI